MSRQISIVCDQCGLQKKESNHWWVGQLSAERLIFTRHDNLLERLADSKGVPTFDVCSEECAHRLLGKWMRGELGK